jgi:hypothetical protein
MDVRGIRARFPNGQTIQTVSGSHPVSYAKYSEDVSPRIKRPESEGDHSPPSSSEGENTGVFMVVIISAQGQFCFYSHLSSIRRCHCKPAALHSDK